MKFGTFRIFVIVSILTVQFYGQVLAQVTVNPRGVAIAMNGDDIHEMVLIITNSFERAIEYSIRVRNNVWEDEERILGPIRDERGGPDDMTYEWRDDQEDDCPPYDWVDITEFDDVLQIEDVVDDSYHGMYELGFEFPYYGDVYNEIGMHSNGFATFISAADIGFFYPAWDIPGEAGDPSPPPTMLAVNYQDLDPLRSGEIFYWTNERDMAIITWEGLSHWRDENEDDGDPWTFQVILFGNGLVKYQFAEIGSYDNADVLIGFQNEARDMGFTCMQDDFEYLEPERVIAFGSEDSWITWLSVDPTEGEIDAEEENEAIIIIDPTGMEDGIYIGNIILNIIDGEEISEFDIPVVLSLNTPVGNVSISVTDAASEEALARALVVIDPPQIGLLSNDEGEVSINNLPIGMYSITLSHPDYFDLIIDDVEVVEGETTEITGALLHAEFNLNIEDISVQLGEGEQEDVVFAAANGGNAELSWSVERRLPGGADADPYTLRDEFMVGENQDDNGIRGSVFVGDQFYVSGSNDRNPTIYILDRDGGQVGSFVQPGEDRNGMKDLAWDGELLWGSIGETVYGMELEEGEVVVEINAPFNPTSCLAWDADLEYFWVCGTTTDINGIDREGNIHAEFDRQGLRTYGLAYWSDDPDGFNLYLYNMFEDIDDDRKPALHKMNTETGELMFVTWLENERGGGALGAYITNQYDIYSWVMIATSSASDNQGRDRIDIWQLDARMDWMEIDPTEGDIEEEDSLELTVTLDATDLPEGVDFEGELVFTHNGVGGETVLPITLSVIIVEEPPPDEPPSAFDILSPNNEEVFLAPEFISFEWQQSIDPDVGDSVLYNIWFQFEEDSVSFATMDTTIEMPINDLLDSLVGGGRIDELRFGWWVNALSNEFVIESNNRFSFSIIPDGVNPDDHNFPTEFSIVSTYPNPFNDWMNIRFGLISESSPYLRLYDLSGRSVREQYLGQMRPGYHLTAVDGANLTAGVYLLELASGNEVTRWKIILMK